MKKFVITALVVALLAYLVVLLTQIPSSPIAGKIEPAPLAVLGIGLQAPVIFAICNENKLDKARERLNKKTERDLQKIEMEQELEGKELQRLEHESLAERERWERISREHRELLERASELKGYLNSDEN